MAARRLMKTPDPGMLQYKSSIHQPGDVMTPTAPLHPEPIQQERGPARNLHERKGGSISARAAELDDLMVVTVSDGAEGKEPPMQSKTRSLTNIALWSLTPPAVLAAIVSVAAPAQALANAPVLFVMACGLATAIASMLIKTED